MSRGPVLKRVTEYAATACLSVLVAGAQSAPSLQLVRGSAGGDASSAAAAATSPASTSSSTRSTTSSRNPSDAPYTIGSGDLLGISVWKEKELSPNVTVRPDGKISIPLIGEIKVVGLTPTEVEAMLRERLEAIVVNPRVTVTVVEIHSRMVYITGEVGRPGAYPLNGPIGVLQLIAQAGGLSEFAARKKIQIVRANSGEKSISFDYNKVLRSNDPARDLLLGPGDTVVVP